VKASPESATPLNVVIAMSDGDNLTIPEAYNPHSDRWAQQPSRRAPGWVGHHAGHRGLMPAIWDTTHHGHDGDEIVDIMARLRPPLVFPDA